MPDSDHSSSLDKSPVSSKSAGPYEAFVGLGANLGDAQALLRQVFNELSALPGTRLLAASGLYRSAPVDATGPDFINAVAHLHTQLEPVALLAALQALENAHGRQRPYRHAPRTLDLDLLSMNGPDGPLHWQSPTLTLPHPRIFERAFVLLPLAEIAPERVSPAQRQAVAGQAIQRLA